MALSSDQLYPSLVALKANPERLTLFLSPFRIRSLNPEHYDQKMKVWYGIIKEFSDAERKLCFSIKDVEHKVMLQCGKKPGCLPEVFENLARERQLVEYDEFMKSLENNNSWLSWSTNKVKWAIGILWRQPSSKIERDTKLVFIPQFLPEETLVSSISTLSIQVRSLEEFKNEVSSKTGLVGDIDVVIKYLKASGKLATDNLGPTELVKLVTPFSSTKVITQLEKGQYDIQRTTEILEKDLKKLEEKRNHAENLARISLKEGKRATAKSHLKTRKLTEKRIEKLSSVLDNLSAITIQIDDAESDANVISAYEVGKKTLDQILKDNNLTTDRINDVMLDIKELMEDQAEISANISMPLIDEETSQIEDELEELIKDAEKEKQVEDENETLEELQKLTIDDLDDLSTKFGSPTEGNPEASFGI